MFNDAVGFKKIFRKVGYTDLRKGIPGLTAIIRKSFGYDPYEKNVFFLFCGRKADRTNFCMHKHTWRLIDTINGAKASALVYSIVETAKANGLHPFRYLEFLLTEMMEHEEDTDYGFLDDLLPWSESIPDIFKIQSKK